MQKSYAPIVLFVYNRPGHTQRTIEALTANEGAAMTDIIIYADGPKTSNDQEQVKLIRKYIDTIQGFKSVSIVLRDKNLGLANSIIDGVTEVLKKYERVIVMEDDLVTSPYFLRYMNESLDYYKDDDRVVSIHGYIYPVQKPVPETFFLRGADCWGWATWQRGWFHFNPDGEWLLSQLRLRKLTKKFDFNGSFSYSSMLKGQVAGTNNSWAVRWYASAFLQNKLTLYPGRSLVQNIGHDSSGEHCETSEKFNTALSMTPIRINDIAIEDSREGRVAFTDFFRGHHSLTRNIFTKIFHKLTRNL